MICLILLLPTLTMSQRYVFTPDKRVVEESVEFIGEAFHNNTANETGWVFLKIVTQSAYSDEEQFFAAGYLEGYLTYHEIYNAYLNFIFGVNEGRHYLPKETQNYVESQYQWMKKQIEIETSTFWNQVRNLLLQLEGMFEGYMKMTKGTHMELSFWQFYYLTNMGDLNDLVPRIGTEMRNDIGNCDSFYRNGIMAHSTFNIYSLMLRVFKSYHFGLNDNVNNNISFSSRPGDLNSKDDFVILWDQEMVLVETSFNNYNDSNFQYYHYDSLPCWVRVNVASRLATSPEEWANLFKIHRSGTHNNQWLITDFSDVFMIEEAFYLYYVHNFTDKYLSDGYVASYNVPYQQEIYDQNNYIEGWKTNYENDVRAKQFKKYGPTLNTVDEIAKIVRYNKVTPEFNLCMGALSPRCDLFEGGGKEFKPFGGIDGKTINKEMLQNKKIKLISSPTYQDHPPFQWSQFPQYPHHGMTNEWHFPWYEYDDQKFEIKLQNYDE